MGAEYLDHQRLRHPQRNSLPYLKPRDNTDADGHRLTFHDPVYSGSFYD
jgi:hypothetical protein